MSVQDTFIGSSPSEMSELLAGREIYALLDRLIDIVKALGLKQLLLILLEMHMPLAGVLGQLALLGVPSAAPLLGLNPALLNELLSKREYLDYLLKNLQED